jgi:hypothetical protein
MGMKVWSVMFGSNVHAAHVDFGLLRPSLIVGSEGLGFFRSASQLETDGNASDAPQRAAECPGLESMDETFADQQTL